MRLQPKKVFLKRITITRLVSATIFQLAELLLFEEETTISMLLLASSFLPLDEHFAFSSTLEGLFSSNKNWMLMYNDYINKARFETYAIAYNALHCQCEMEYDTFINVKLWKDIQNIIETEHIHNMAWLPSSGQAWLL